MARARNKKVSHPARRTAETPTPAGKAHRKASAEDYVATFPIVGVGASAGGLNAYIELLRALPSDTGMAYVLVQHMDPTHQSMLSEILARECRLPVTEVSNHTRTEPN